MPAKVKKVNRKRLQNRFPKKLSVFAGGQTEKSHQEGFN